MIAENISEFTPTNTECDATDLKSIRDKVSLFGALSEEQLASLEPMLKSMSVEVGHTIFNQDQLPCNVYIVLSGEVGMEVEREDGTTARLDFKMGDCFGESAVIGIQPQLGSAFATKDSRLLVISRSDLLDIANTDMAIFGILMMNVAREVSRRLHSSISAPAGADSYSILRA